MQEAITACLCNTLTSLLGKVEDAQNDINIMKLVVKPFSCLSSNKISIVSLKYFMVLIHYVKTVLILCWQGGVKGRH